MKKVLALLVILISFMVFPQSCFTQEIVSEPLKFIETQSEVSYQEESFLETYCIDIIYVACSTIFVFAGLLGITKFIFDYFNYKDLLYKSEKFPQNYTRPTLNVNKLIYYKPFILLSLSALFYIIKDYINEYWLPNC